ncbi:MAG: preprotein translocase subunit SecY [Lachnospiraceae bacterium]|nr:preprotein translocase subunit SecY [Candidatus Hippenecus merdae]MCQ2415203.1 preprotein translocase subunit SecY [Lachnospiraceae bacterium]
MIKSIINAFKIKEVRDKILYTLLMLVIIRFGSVLPIPGVNTTYFAELLGSVADTDAFGWFNAMTGGSFTDLSVFALSITPYITSSIIIQLLTIAIPALERLQKEGDDGRRKIAEYTRYVTVALALIESTAMAVGFGGSGLLYNYNFWSVIVCVVAMTAGSALLMWIGECITEKGVGNGISVVLLFNILASLPDDLTTIYATFLKNKTLAVGIVLGAIIIAVIIGLVVFTVLLNEAVRNIPVQYSRKMQGRHMVGGSSSNIPLKVNTASVIPVIFASSILSIPVIIGQLTKVDYSTFIGKVVLCCNSGNWCRPELPWANIGLVVYIVMIILFAYFYTDITFNPLEVANNMKKNGGFIPGIRPGKPTSDYLQHILKYIIFIGAVGLVIVCLVPILCSGLFGIGRLSFMGTSLIIIVGVVLETLSAIESMMLVRNYKGFLND